MRFAVLLACVCMSACVVSAYSRDCGADADRLGQEFEEAVATRQSLKLSGAIDAGSMHEVKKRLEALCHNVRQLRHDCQPHNTCNDGLACTMVFYYPVQLPGAQQLEDYCNNGDTSFQNELWAVLEQLQKEVIANR